MSEAPMQSFFVNRDTGALVRIKEVDDTFAYLEVIAPAPATYAMPLSDYDNHFVKMFRPAEATDLRSFTGATFRLPSNAPDDWR